MSSYERIRALLKHIRRRQFRRRLLAVLAASAWISLLFVAAGSLLLGLAYSRWLHAAVLFGWLGGLVTLWIRRFFGPAVRVRRDASTAVLLESHFPHLRSDLTSSLEFGAALSKSSDEEHERLGSPVLMQALVDQAAVQLEREAVGLERTLPSHRIPWLRKAAIGGLVGFALLFVVLPGPTRSGLERLFSGPPPILTARSATAAQQEPLVGRIVVTYHYPAYTQRREVSRTNPTGRIEVLAGTEVTLEALALRPVNAASLVLRTGERDGEAVETEIGMSVAGRDLRVLFTPLQNATYTFDLVGPNGEPMRDPVNRTITVVPDAPPQVQLITPDALVEAGPTDVLPFRFAVSDDFGLTELAFVHAFAADSEHERRQTLLTLDGELVLQDGAGFDLGPLALQPRDEVLIFVEAVDNDTISGPKAGRSRPVLVRIASPDDRHLALIEDEDAIYEALIDVLGDYLENPISDLHVDENGLRFTIPDLPAEGYAGRYSAAQRISRKVFDLLAAMRDLLGRMEADELLLVRDYELFQTIYERLYELHRSEQNVLTSMSRPAARATLSRYHMQRIEAVRTDQVRETERSILTLEEMIAAQRMESLVQTLEELDQIQARLRDLLEQYRETQDPALRAEIERELMRLEARMRELLDRLSQLMERLPSEHYNVEALQEMGELRNVGEMVDVLQRIREMIEAGDIEAALDMLDQLQADIQAMLEQMSTSESMGGSGLSELDQRMSELVDEINDLEAQESDIEQDTGALQEEIRQRRIEALQEGLERFVQEARERVAEMRRELESIDRDSLRSSVAEQLAEAGEQLESLDEMLEAEDFESSLDRAERTLERLSSAAFELRSLSRRYSPSSERGQRYGEALERVDHLNEEARSLAQDLSELLERARPAPGAQDQPRLEELAESQGLTLQELAELLERVQQMGQDMPMIEEELSPGLRQVEGFMEGAEHQLRGGRIQGAREDEQAALRQLRQLRDQMHQMVQRQRMGGRMGTAIERVEIPEEPDETPAEFREDILDAMREQSLQSYQEAIRRYYESLVE